MILNETPAELVISQRLRNGEHLIWCGRPHSGLRLTRSDGVMIPFSILWAGFSFFWEYSVIHSGGPLFFQLWGLPFVMAGLYILVGRFFYDAYRRARTWYGLSDRRAIIVSRVWSTSEKSVNPSVAEQIEIDQLPNGFGSIYFGTRPSFLRSRGSKATDPPAFELIEDVQRVYDLVLNTDFSRKI